MGYKYSSQDGTYRFNAAYYLMNWQDMQTAVYDRDLATIQFNTNIGDAKITGIELDWTIITDNGLTVAIAGAFTNPKLEENFILDGEILATPGTQLANVAKQKYSLSFNKDFNVMGRDGFWDLNLSRTGSRPSSVTNPISQPGYTTSSFSSTFLGENWDGVFYVDNILDGRAVIWEYQGFRPETKFTNRPREIGIRIKYKL